MTSVFQELGERIRGELPELMSTLPALWATLGAELNAFADFLEALGQ